MYDDRYSRRYNRRLNRYRNPMRGLAGGILIIGLAFAFYFSDTIGWNFLAILFTVLAFVSLISAASSGNPRAFYGGLYPFVWFLGLALCFLIGFWPWILIPVGVCMILGALYNPITAGLSSSGFMANQPSPPQSQQPYQPYQQGYQPPPPAPGTYQESSNQYPPQPKQEYDQPIQEQEISQSQQEMPPQQQ